MKYYCEACERLVPPATFRLEDGLLVLKCSRCKVETRCGPEQDEAPPAAAVSGPAQAPVIMLAQSEAEPDPIENEPTRRVAVPASILSAIESEAKAARAKAKKSETEEAAAAKQPAPRRVMSEAAASNLVVLRFGEVQSRADAERSPPSEEAAEGPSPVQARAGSSQEDPFMPPPGYCPKCIGVRKEGAVVCPYCGLEYARFRLEELRPSPALSSTWLGVLELWESKSAHDKVLALASEKGELAALGRLYRIQQARSPEDAQAKRGREEVLRLASAGSNLLPSPPPDKRMKLKTAGLGLLLFFLVAAAVLIIHQARRMLLEP